MIVYTIDCKRYKLNDVESSLGEDKTVTTEDNKEIYATFYIDCEDDEDNNSFNLEQYGDDGMIIERNRCELNVYIKENKTPYEKNFIIDCVHSNDRSIYVQIKIVQIAEEYKIMFTSSEEEEGPTEITKNLKSIIQNSAVSNDDSNYNYYEEQNIDICVIGGSKKYRIENIIKCHEEIDSAENITQYIYSPFDRGFVYTKMPNSLLIRNYGRPFLSENDYYIITLCHEDYREIKAKIIIRYLQIRRRNNMFLQNNNRQTIERNIQVSDIYKIKEDITDTINVTNEINNTCQIIINEGGTNIQKQTDGYKIVGQTNATLSFKVMENEEISNLMVRVKTQGNWCSIVLDEQNIENRKIKIKILDKPICTRKTLFTMSVVDYPNVTKTFIVTNEIG